MNILFVHQNFPAQFVHIAPALKARGHRVMALRAETAKGASPVPVVVYPWNAEEEEKVAGFSRSFTLMAERGRRAAEAANALKNENNFTPDVILAHVGWGEAMFLKQVWPAARLILYVEHYYRAQGSEVDFDSEFGGTSLEKRMRIEAMNAGLLMSIEKADHLLSPTRFQAGMLPQNRQAATRVIHDGIDTDTIHPDPQAVAEIPGTSLRFAAGGELLTFVSRSLEPYRGFHIFMRALPKLLAQRPGAQVVIVGDESPGYGKVPSGDWTWKKLMLRELGHRLDLSRVHFAGQLPKPVLVKLMQAARVHCYLTYPFVLSWSLLEFMSAGSLVVGSRTPPVEEVIRDGVNGRLVDFFDVDGLSATLAESLAEPERFASLRQAARQTVAAGHDLARVSLPELVGFVEAAAAGNLDKQASIF